MSETLIAFSTFRDQLRNKKKLFNGDESFSGKIIYNFQKKSLQETLKVKISLTTQEYGNVAISEGKILKTGVVHMDFKTEEQKYSYNQEGFLIITGNSKQIGNYEVKICEV